MHSQDCRADSALNLDKALQRSQCSHGDCVQGVREKGAPTCSRPRPDPPLSMILANARAKEAALLSGRPEGPPCCSSADAWHSMLTFWRSCNGHQHDNNASEPCRVLSVAQQWCKLMKTLHLRLGCHLLRRLPAPQMHLMLRLVMRLLFQVYRPETHQPHLRLHQTSCPPHLLAPHCCFGQDHLQAPHLHSRKALLRAAQATQGVRDGCRWVIATVEDCSEGVV